VGRLPLNLDELVEHWTVLEDERVLVAGKRGATRLGFALLLKFFTRHGRFPRGGGVDLPDEVVAFVAKQVEVEPSDLAAYEWTGRTIEYYRSQIRRHLGFRECSVADAEKLVSWLAEHVTNEERRPERVRDELLAKYTALRYSRDLRKRRSPVERRIQAGPTGASDDGGFGASRGPSKLRSRQEGIERLRPPHQIAVERLEGEGWGDKVREIRSVWRPSTPGGVKAGGGLGHGGEGGLGVDPEGPHAPVTALRHQQRAGDTGLGEVGQPAVAELVQRPPAAAHSEELCRPPVGEPCPAGLALGVGARRLASRGGGDAREEQGTVLRPAR
jgi:hypothetical protein